MTNIGIYGYPQSTGAAVRRVPSSRQVFDLVRDYGVKTNASADANYQLIQRAFADAAKVGGTVYLRGATDHYMTRTLTLPPAPITLEGDGPTTSILGTTDGTILTYNNLNPIPISATQPFSYVYGSQGGKGIAYQNNVWQIKNMGFTKSDGWGGNKGNGFHFPKWDSSVNPYQKLLLWMTDVIISNFNGNADGTGGTDGFGWCGLYYYISGAVDDTRFIRVTVTSCQDVGWATGGDTHYIDCMAHSNGLEGFYNNSYTWAGNLFRSYDNGKAHIANRMSGMLLKGTPAGVLVEGVTAQDNNGPAVTITGPSSGFVISDVISDRNCWQAGNNCGVLIDDTNGAITDCKVTNVIATDSADASKTNVQLHAIKIVGANTGSINNQFSVTQFQYSGGRTVTDPVDPASNTNGWAPEVGASEGGEIAVAFNSAGFTPPGPYAARTQVVGTLTANMTGNIAVPTYAHKGVRMAFKFTQDGTGGRTISWAAGYKQAFVTTGNTLNKTTIVEFEYDGTNWVQLASNVWV